MLFYKGLIFCLFHRKRLGVVGRRFNFFTIRVGFVLIHIKHANRAGTVVFSAKGNGNGTVRGLTQQCGRRHNSAAATQQCESNTKVYIFCWGSMFKVASLSPHPVSYISGALSHTLQNTRVCTMKS